MSSPGETPGYEGPFGACPVPYSRGVFYFHWFNFYNAVCFQIIMGAPIVLLAKDLGAGSAVLGVIASFTPILTILQLPAARYLGKYGYRPFALAGWGLRSLFIVVLALVPLFHFFSKEQRLWILLGCLFFFNVLRGISSAAFLPWITGVVGNSFRGRFISIDHTFIGAGSLVAMLLSALVMRGDALAWRYSLVLWISAGGAVAALLFLRLVPDARVSPENDRCSEKVGFREMMSCAPFRNTILFSLLFSTVAGGLGVFPVEYLRVQAHFSPSLIYALSAATFLGPMLVLRRFGRLVDRVGSIPVIRLAAGLFALVLAFWFAMSGGLVAPTWWMVLILNLSGGMAMAGFNMANLHLGMEVVPERGKNHFFALSTVIASLGVGVVPILWGWLLDTLGGLDLTAGPLHLRRHSVYFLGITLLSLLSLFATRILMGGGGQRSGGEAT